jgi:meso-butanediol dehydrogenase/(S,S)-butanediol dehydrogenase/diacetyl reductase
MDVNALGVLIGTQEAAKQMIAQGSGGKIVNTSSIAGRQGYPSFAPYCASKFAVMALTQATARGLAEHGITANAFAPGVVVTPLWDRLDEDLMDIGDADEPGPGHGRVLGRDPARPAGDHRRHRRHRAVPRVRRVGLHDGQVLMIDGGMVLV